MFVGFTHDLYKKLIENEFRPMVANELSKDSKSLIVMKQIGPIAYMINIVNVDGFAANMYKPYIEQLESAVAFNNDYVQHSILLNVLVTQDIDEELIEFVNDVSLDSEKKIHLVNWAVDLTKLRLVTAKDSDKVLNISNMIKDILERSVENSVDKIELEALTRKVIEESALTVKSQNSYLTYLLMGVNLGIFVLMYIYGRNMDATELIIKFGANSPEHIFYDKQYYRLFTSMFVHIDLTHMMYNGFSLYLFGTRVEKYFGKKAFLIIYIVSGLVGSMASVLFTQSISAGASGAIYGLIGAVCVLSYQREKQIDGLSFYILLTIAIVGLGFGFLGRNIDNFAHIGGLMAGYASGFIFCEKEEDCESDY